MKWTSFTNEPAVTGTELATCRQGVPRKGVCCAALRRENTQAREVDLATNGGNDYARDVKRKGLANAQQRMARQRAGVKPDAGGTLQKSAEMTEQ